MATISMRGHHSKRPPINSSTTFPFLDGMRGIIKPEVGIEPTTCRLQASCSSVPLFQGISQGGCLGVPVGREKPYRRRTLAFGSKSDTILSQVSHGVDTGIVRITFLTATSSDGLKCSWLDRTPLRLVATMYRADQGNLSGSVSAQKETPG